MRLFGHAAAISIRLHLAPIARVFNVIAHRQYHLIRRQPLFDQIEHEQIRHLLHNQPRLVKRIWALQHLSGADAAGHGAICVDICHRAGFIAPCVINQQLGVNAKQPIQQRFVQIGSRLSQRAARNIAHRKQAVRRQSPGCAASDPPEIRNRPMIPQLLSILPLIQFGNAHPVRVRLHVLGDNIHRNLAQIEVCADARRRRNARLAQHRFDHLCGQLARGHAIRRQIARHVNKNLIHRIHADVLLRNIAQIDLVNLCAHLHIVRHLRRRDNIIQRQFRRNPERVRVAAFSVKSAVWRAHQTPRVNLLHLFDHLKEPRAPRNAIGLERRRHRQTDGFFRPIGVGNDEMGFQRIQPPRHTFHRSIKRFEVNRDICPLFHSSRLRKVAIWMIPVALYRRYHRFSSEIFAIWATPHRI